MRIVGIDLGTTNSLVGVIEKGRPKLLADANGETLIPSVVAFDTYGSAQVGAPAREIAATSDGRALYSAKRFIGLGRGDVHEWMQILPFDFSESTDQVIRFKVDDRVYTPIEISSIVLKKLKFIAQSHLGEQVDKAVITVPAYFNDAQRQATKLAGELAGLEVVRIINEPTAACLAYGLDKKAKGIVAVFDLGGGTFDISILRISDGVIEVLATNGDTRLGGDDFDHAIAQRLRNEIRAASEIDPWLNKQDRTQLIAMAEKLKRQLSDREVASFEFSPASSQDEKVFAKDVSREQQREWLSELLDRLEAPTRQCLSDAKVTCDQVSDVILVGGSTRSPVVRERVTQLFRKDPICTINPDEVVAMGAAVQANVLSGQATDILLLDVVPLSLGIETVGGVVSRIIHRNSTIPISASEQFTTYVDGQVSVDIHVVQGERELVKDCRSLARFQLRGLPPLPAGIPKIEVEFIIDANGILNVRALELRTATSTSVVINPSYGLTDSEVEKMLLEAHEQAESDFEKRFLAEARTEAEIILRATEKSLEYGGNLISEEQRTEIRTSVTNLKAALTQDDSKVIRSRIEELNAVTRPLAEHLMDQAVHAALKDKSVAPPSGKTK